MSPRVWEIDINIMPRTACHACSATEAIVNDADASRHDNIMFALDGWVGVFKSIEKSVKRTRELNGMNYVE